MYTVFALGQNTPILVYYMNLGIVACNVNCVSSWSSIRGIFPFIVLCALYGRAI